MLFLQSFLHILASADVLNQNNFIIEMNFFVMRLLCCLIIILRIEGEYSVTQKMMCI